MKKIKQIKRIAAVVMAVSVAVGLTACQQKTDSQGNSTQTGTLQKVLKERKMTVGCILSFPPFGYKSEDGTPMGYDVDMIHELADSLGHQESKLLQGLKILMYFVSSHWKVLDRHKIKS